jgi:molybdenum cofactor cytidylyltransferase
MEGGADKLLLPFRGKTLFMLALELLDSMPFYEKIVVTTDERLKKAELQAGIIPIINPHPENGQGESVSLGTKAAGGSRYLFLGADQPLLNRDTLRWLLLNSRENAGKIVCPSVEGKPSNPVIFPARFRDELLALLGDAGGRAVRKAHPEDCLLLPAKDSRIFRDIDRMEDYLGLIAGGEA